MYLNLEWLWHEIRMDLKRVSMKIFKIKPDNTETERPRLRCLEDVKNDL